MVQEPMVQEIMQVLISYVMLIQANKAQVIVLVNIMNIIKKRKREREREKKEKNYLYIIQYKYDKNICFHDIILIQNPFFGYFVIIEI
jgi:hypothetical protein